MDGLVSSAALGLLMHPDQSVATVGPVGLTLVWADADRLDELVEALDRSLAFRMPALYAGPARSEHEVPLFSLVRVGVPADILSDDDGAIDELMGRLEQVREAVPAAIRDLSEQATDTAAALEAADQRREQLKAALQAQAPVLAGTPEARTLVGLQRRMATVEIERRGLGTVEVTALRRAYEALVHLEVGELPVDPEAARLAVQWERLLADEALLDDREPRHPLTDQLLAVQAKLRLAEQALAVARADVERPRPTPADRAEIERLHALVEDSVEIGGKRGGRRAEGGGPGDALAHEAALLQRFGFGSYADYIIAGAIDPPIAAAARYRAAEQKVAAIQGMLEELQSHMAPSPARQDLLERAERLAADIEARFGHIDPSEDVAAVLRTVRRPPAEWDELAGALRDLGREPGDDPLTVAYGVLSEVEGRRVRIAAAEAELAELRARLAAVGPDALARHGAIAAAAAELVHLEAARVRIAADLHRLRTRLSAELERDPALRPTLETIAALDRELAGLARRLAAEGEAGPGRPPAEVVAEVLASALAAGDGPVVAALEGPFEEALDSVPRDQVVLCVEVLAALAGSRQLIVLTASEVLAEVVHAGTVAGVGLTFFKS